jgi:oxygen-dependent protoporphyrinogen oxidase
MVVDGVILATPAPHAANLLQEFDQPLAEDLQQIEYASCAVVSLGYRREQIGNALDGFGFVVPLVENRLILSCSYSSVKYAGRAPDDCVLLRVFIGGACQSGLLQLPREQLMELAQREVASLLQIRGEPMLQYIVRQKRAMPQYQIGHCERVRRIESRLAHFPSFAIASNSLHGVGVPACIAGGERAAEQINRCLLEINHPSSQPAFT